MNKIDSFRVDHERLEKGLYVSRVDTIGNEVLTTFDLRMKKPNHEKLDAKSIHTMEHLVATFVRNDSEFGSKIVYFGPMGCLTGMYLIVHGQYVPQDILPLIIRAFEFIETFEGEIPGVSAIECGNCDLHDLDEAKVQATAYLNVLKNATDINFNYPE